MTSVCKPRCSILPDEITKEASEPMETAMPQHEQPWELAAEKIVDPFCANTTDQANGNWLYDDPKRLFDPGSAAQ